MPRKKKNATTDTTPSSEVVVTSRKSPSPIVAPPLTDVSVGGDAALTTAEADVISLNKSNRKEEAERDPVEANDNSVAQPTPQKVGCDINTKEPRNTNQVQKQQQEKSKVKGGKLKKADKRYNKTANDDDDEGESEREGDGWKIAACCLCHCGLDFSDRAAFFREDREEDYSRHEAADNENDDDEDSRSSYFFRPNDPYLPSEHLYDKYNALIYCDGCNRLYHQKCHFVPLTVLPRGQWHCLLCQSLQQMPSYYKNSHSTEVLSKTKRKNQKAAKPTKKTKRRKTNEKSKSITDYAHTITMEEEETERKQREQDHRAWLTVVPHISKMFVSPPNPKARPAEIKWEYLVRHLKAALWQTELNTRLKQAVTSQASSYRLAETAAITLTSTQKNRTIHVSNLKGMVSQQFAQTLVRLYSCRLQWREMCFNLDRIRRFTNDAWHALHMFVQEYYRQNRRLLLSTESAARKDEKVESDFVKRVLFPFGTKHTRRIEPRTAEMKKALLEQNKKDSIPKEIFIFPDDDDYDKRKGGKKNSKKNALVKTTKKQKVQVSPNGSKKGRATAANPKKVVDSDENQNTRKIAESDEDSGISLGNLRCCICHTDTATDENDLVMCDGSGCYRAYHMKCLKPPLTLADVENEELPDWFCPICLALSKTLLSIQIEYMGEDWEQERYEQQQHNKQQTDNDSHKSWDKPDEVFPTAAQDYAAACQMKQGIRNKATDDLLARILGVDQLSDHDSDDEIEDEHFDLNSFEEKRRKSKQQELRKRRRSDSAEGEESEKEEEDSDDDQEESSNSSQATLVEMSSVELEIGKGELDALSKGSSDTNDNDDASDAKRGSIQRRSSRRNGVGMKTSSRSSSVALLDSHINDDNKSKTDNPDVALANLGEFNESNIIQGKRGRKPVDYIRLNEAIFGDVSSKEAAKYLDDDDEHSEGGNKKKNHSDEDCDDDDDGNEEQDDDGNGGVVKKDSNGGNFEKHNIVRAGTEKGTTCASPNVKKRGRPIKATSPKSASHAKSKNKAGTPQSSRAGKRKVNAPTPENTAAAGRSRGRPRKTPPVVSEANSPGAE